jgi:hypothetical protein
MNARRYEVPTALLNLQPGQKRIERMHSRSEPAVTQTEEAPHASKAPHAYELNANSLPLVEHVGQNPNPKHVGQTRQACGAAALDRDILDAVFKHALTPTSNDPGLSIFNLRRELEPIGLNRGYQEADWKAVVACWLAASQSNGVEPPGFNSAWELLRRKLSLAIKEPFGNVLEYVKARRPLVVVPAELLGTRLEAVARTMIAFSEEHASRHRQIFYVSFREIAKVSGLLGVYDHKTARRNLEDLCKSGYVSLIAAGTQGTKKGGKASEWEWFSEPRPGQTSWNSNEVIRKRQLSIKNETHGQSSTNRPSPPPTTPTTEGNSTDQPNDGWSVLATGDDDLAESFDELAAKMELDGGLTRADAEQKARLALNMAAQ